MIKNDVFEVVTAQDIDRKNIRLVLKIDSVDGISKTFERKMKLIKYENNEKNDDKIMGILNQWKTESYNAIEKRSKMFIRKYPMVLFHY